MKSLAVWLTLGKHGFPSILSHTSCKNVPSQNFLKRATAVCRLLSSSSWNVWTQVTSGLRINESSLPLPSSIASCDSLRAGDGGMPFDEGLAADDDSAVAPESVGLLLLLFLDVGDPDTNGEALTHGKDGEGEEDTSLTNDDLLFWWWSSSCFFLCDCCSWSCCSFMPSIARYLGVEWRLYDSLIAFKRIPNHVHTRFIKKSTMKICEQI